MNNTSTRIMGLTELRAHASRHHGAFSRAEAARYGVTASQLRRRTASGELTKVDRHVFVVAGAPMTWLQRARIATLTTNGVVSHQSALVLHQIDGVTEGAIHVTIPYERAVRRPDLHIHRSTQYDRVGIIELKGLPTTSIERSLLDYAGLVGQRRFEWAVDAALRQKRCDLATLFETWVAHSIQGRNGSGPMRLLLEQRHMSDPIPDSRWNRMVGRLLSDSNLPIPVYEYEVHDRSGDFLARVDLAYPRHRLAIELDSARWHLNASSFRNDPRRKNRLTVAGWTVLTFTWDDYVERPSALIRTVEAALTAAA